MRGAENGREREEPEKPIQVSGPDALIVRFWQSLKQRFAAKDLMLLGTYGLHMAAYWGLGLTMLFVERYVPSLVRGLKTQPAARVSRAELVKLFKQVLTNQFLLLIPTLILRKVKSKAVDAHFQEIVDRPVPGWKRIVVEWWFHLLIDEIFFYFSHRLLHSKRFYKRIHKRHHEFKAPIGLSAEYAHPFEFLVSNVIPGAIGPLLLNSHPLSMWAWLVGGITLTTFHHSGYMWPFYPFSEWTLMHDYHHYSFYSQLGVVGLLDTVCGTSGGKDYAAWKKEVLARVAQRALAK